MNTVFWICAMVLFLIIEAISSISSQFIGILSLKIKTSPLIGFTHEEPSVSPSEGTYGATLL